MKNIQIKLILFCTLFSFSNLGFSQTSVTEDFSFEVNKVLPPISISSVDLNKAKTLIDLNNRYKTSWVREYISVEIMTISNGNIFKAESKNDNLTQPQIDIIKQADNGSDITVKVKYIPENTLKENDPKEMDFTFKIDPEKEATFPQGEQKLKEYLKENAFDKISKSSFKEFDLAAIKFTVNEQGEVTDAHVFDSMYQSFDDKNVNEILLKAIQKMPKWSPAEFADGTKAKQAYIFSVGNMKSCVVNLLNIRRLAAE